MSSSTSSRACQKNMYGEIVVPRMATSVVTELALSAKLGTKVPRSTACQSGLAKNADPTYANSARVSHLKTDVTTLCDPQTWSASTAAPTGTTIAMIGTGTSRFKLAAIAPISAPALIVFATKSATVSAM